MKRLKTVYPLASVKTTGHSLGGALAQLSGMDLINAGYEVSSYIFGTPRIGNIEFITFSNSKYSDLHYVVNH